MTEDVSSSLASLASCAQVSEYEHTLDEPKDKKSHKVGLAAEFELQLRQRENESLQEEEPTRAV